MTEPPSPKKDGDGTDSQAVEGDKTAVLPPPDDRPSASSGSTPDEAGGSDRTMVITDDALAVEEEGTVLAPPARGRARLVLRAPGGAEEEIPLAKPEITLGRSEDCDIVLPAPTVSRVHARIVQQAAGCLLIPVGTRHNTFVNDEFVSQPRLLHDGDRIQLANEQLVFRFDEGPARPAPVPSRRKPMLLAFCGALGAVALIFLVWRQTHPSPAIPVKENDSAPEQVADDEKQAALERKPQEEAERRQREAEEAQQAEAERQAEEQRREEERRQEEEARLVDARVRKYLYEGDIAFLEKRYTTPPEGSAVFAYKEALRLDPTNERALEQTAKIIDEYLSWAEAALADGRRARAREHFQRAAYVHSEIPAAGDADAIEARLEALRASFGLE